MLAFRVGAALGLVCVLGYAAGCGSEFTGDEPAGSGGGGAHAGGNSGSTGKGGKAGMGGTPGSGGEAGDPSSAGGEPNTGGRIEPGGTGGILNAGTGGLGGLGGGGGSGGGLVMADCSGNYPGPTMVPVASPDGGTYCVDSTEVTLAQYAIFLVNPPEQQLPKCSWNASFTPSDGWPPDPSSGNLPVTFVDWCDAFAYCARAGKHLCGKIGGGPNAPADLADATKSQWYNACSAGGEQAYPYGSTYEPSSCNGEEFPSPDTVMPVGTIETCHGGVGDLHDMSGNVWEWEDSCTGDGGMSDTCQTRGGAYDSLQTALSCAQNQAFYRNASAVTAGYIGFRCCAF